MLQIPIIHLYRDATPMEDMREATDMVNSFRSLSFRCRKNKDNYAERFKYDFTMRLDSGKVTEFEKIMFHDKADAIVYSYHDEKEVISWMIIDLNCLRTLWRAGEIDGTQSKLYRDHKNALDGSPFRCFNVKKIGLPGLVVASSFKIDYSQP